jgi:hypothetical protein
MVSVDSALQKQWWPTGTPDETLQEHVREEHPVRWVEWTAWQTDLRHLEKMFLMADERK